MTNNTHNLIQQRNSNMELLRIICMLLIVAHHFIVHGFIVNLEALNTTMTTDRVIGTALNSIHVSINCFILISGYFGIRFRLRSLLKLYLTMLFFAVGYYLLTVALGDKTFLWSQLGYVSRTFSHGPWWFMVRYFYLFMLAPLINYAIQNIDKRTFLTILLMMTFVNVVTGYSGHSLNNLSGNSTAHFIFVYCIGRYIKIYANPKKEHRWHYLAMAILCMALIIAASIINKWYYNFTAPNLRLMYHNNPLNLIASIAFFLFFCTINFRSRAVNWIASGVLAAYLLQDNSMYISKQYIYGTVKSWWQGIIGADSWWGLNYDLRWLQFTILVIAFLLIAVLIDKLFRFAFLNPLMTIYDKAEPRFKIVRQQIINWLNTKI